MGPAWKVAFVANLGTGYFQRLLRGALRYADESASVSIRSFGVLRRPLPTFGAQPAVKSLRAWQPDGILAGLMDPELAGLRAALRKPIPIVNVLVSTKQPGMAMVLGSNTRRISLALRHFRQTGIRNCFFLFLDPCDAPEELHADIRSVDSSTHPEKVLLIEPTGFGSPSRSKAPATPMPKRLVAWLRGLPKPAGVYCYQLGGGGYLIRVCHKLGLRVPQDVAVIGGDDADESLMSNPTLTSVLPSAEQVGTEAMMTLAGMLAGGPAPREIIRVEATEIHIRQSTGRKPQACNVDAAVDYINRRACEGISVDDVLDETQDVSRVTFYREFRKATGQLPGVAIRKRQIEESCRLLRNTELSVSVVARMCGFSDNSAFARAFRASRGQSPTDFRGRNARRR